MSGFARDGHVLDLGLERFLLDDLAPADRRAVKAHLRDCALCRDRVEAIRLDLSVPLPPLDATRAAPATPGTPAGRVWVGVVVGALAALVTAWWLSRAR